MGRPIGYNKKIEIPKEELKELYLEKNLSARQIAKMYNTSKSVILRRLKEYEIPIKTQHDYVKDKILQHEYYYVMVKNHPDADKDGYILEHRYVVEQIIGRYLTKDELVHHVNGVKTDNRIENLKLMSKAEHTKLHHTGMKYSKEVREKISRIKKEQLKDPKNHPRYKNINPLELLEMRENGFMIKEICKKHNIDKVTYYNKINKFKESAKYEQGDVN